VTSNQLYPISDLQGKVDGNGTWREQGADAYGMVEIMLSTAISPVPMWRPKRKSNHRQAKQK
jgi:hypothetical protein